MPGYTHLGTEATLDGINVKDCAVLVVDELGDLTDSPLKDLLLPPTLNTARICEAARKAGTPVIFANDAHIEGLDKELELWGNHNLAGDPNSDPTPELNVQETDYIIEKRRYSAFFQTSLQLLLNELGANTLIVCGFDTNICVVHTAADAYFNNFQLIVVPDATETFLVGDQQTGLEYMEKCYAAKLANTDQVLDLLSE